jgi:Tfp pilus assembly protein PilW
MTSSPNNPVSNRKRIAGFTLTEVLVAAFIGVMVLTGVLTTFVMLVRSEVRLENYSTMETQVRRAFEQMGIDARMANGFASHFTNGVITSFTLTIPSEDMSTVTQVTYGYDSTNKELFLVPNTSDPTVTTGRQNLMQNVTTLTFLRYDSSGTLIAASTTSDAHIKHIQVSITASSTNVGAVAATQVIRSSAFTIRNITI